MAASKQLILPFTVIQGHQVASGLAVNSPFPAGTIGMQAPYFKALGLDISAYYAATINAQFGCESITIKNWHYYFDNVYWAPGWPCESFGFITCQIQHQQIWHSALVYQPDKACKIGHHQASNCLELLAPKLTPLHYGDKLAVKIDADLIEVK